MGEKYRVINGRIAHANGVRREGDVFEPVESTIRALAERKGRIEPVDGEETEEVDANGAGDEPGDTTNADANGSDDDGSGESNGDDEDELDYDSLTISELKKVLRERDFSADELRDLIDYEGANKNRNGAKKALEKALEDFESEE